MLPTQTTTIESTKPGIYFYNFKNPEQLLSEIESGINDKKYVEDIEEKFKLEQTNSEEDLWQLISRFLFHKSDNGMNYHMAFLALKKYLDLYAKDYKFFLMRKINEITLKFSFPPDINEKITIDAIIEAIKTTDYQTNPIKYDGFFDSLLYANQPLLPFKKEIDQIIAEATNNAYHDVKELLNKTQKKMKAEEAEEALKYQVYPPELNAHQEAEKLCKEAENIAGPNNFILHQSDKQKVNNWIKKALEKDPNYGKAYYLKARLDEAEYITGLQSIKKIKGLEETPSKIIGLLLKAIECSSVSSDKINAYLFLIQFEINYINNRDKTKEHYSELESKYFSYFTLEQKETFEKLKLKLYPEIKPSSPEEENMVTLKKLTLPNPFSSTKKSSKKIDEKNPMMPTAKDNFFESSSNQKQAHNGKNVLEHLASSRNLNGNASKTEKNPTKTAEAIKTEEIENTINLSNQAGNFLALFDFPSAKHHYELVLKSPGFAHCTQQQKGAIYGSYGLILSNDDNCSFYLIDQYFQRSVNIFKSTNPNSHAHAFYADLLEKNKTKLHQFEEFHTTLLENYNQVKKLYTLIRIAKLDQLEASINKLTGDINKQENTSVLALIHCFSKLVEINNNLGQIKTVIFNLELKIKIFDAFNLCNYDYCRTLLTTAFFYLHCKNSTKATSNLDKLENHLNSIQWVEKPSEILEIEHCIITERKKIEMFEMCGLCEPFSIVLSENYKSLTSSIPASNSTNDNFSALNEVFKDIDIILNNSDNDDINHLPNTLNRGFIELGKIYRNLNRNEEALQSFETVIAIFDNFQLDKTKSTYSVVRHLIDLLHSEDKIHQEKNSINETKKREKSHINTAQSAMFSTQRSYDEMRVAPPSTRHRFDL